MSHRWLENTTQELFAQQVEEHPDKVAIVNEGTEEHTFADVMEDANRVSGALQQLGVGEGDHVAILMSTFPEFVHAMYGTLQLGSRFNPYNIMWGTSELGQVMERADPKVLITMDEFQGTDYIRMIRTALPDLEVNSDGSVESERVPSLERLVSYSLNDETYEEFVDYEEFVEMGDDYDEDELADQRQQNENDDAQFILQTSGTTGVSKSALQHHRSLLGNAHFASKEMNYKKGETYINFAPFYHNAGLVLGVITNTAYVGNTVYLQEFFKPAEALDLIEEHEIDAAFGFGTMYAALKQVPNFEEYDFPIRKGVLGATPAQYDMIVDMSDADEDDTYFTHTYAQTESGPIITLVQADNRNHELRKYSKGKPVAGIEMTIKDPQTGEELGPGDGGELCYRGWSLFDGYYNQPERTEEGYDEDGYWHSGDYGWIDGAHVYFKGRLDDVVKSGGENVSTKEVETFLADQFDELAEAQVVGVDDDYWGDRVVAFVEYAEGADKLTTEEWRERCKGKIADYKIPKNFIEIEADWPVTPTGKIQKDELAGQAEAILEDELRTE
ncbi:MAG: fatty-acyl-CoA synthase [Natrialbaceae archaeon]|jgi:fatty-acyl-CoA synthase